MSINVLYLTNKNKLAKNEITNFISNNGDKVFITCNKNLNKIIKEKKIKFIVSDRYRFKIKDNVILKFKKNIINLHHSYLPFSRGWQPIFWTVYDRKPLGVTIHYVSNKIDSGNIIIQKKINYKNDDSLNELYAKVRTELTKLFKKNWISIKKNKNKSKKNKTLNGTIHFRKEDFIIKKIINKKGWKTLVSDVKEYKKNSLSSNKQ